MADPKENLQAPNPDKPNDEVSDSILEKQPEEEKRVDTFFNRAKSLLESYKNWERTLSRAKTNEIVDELVNQAEELSQEVVVFFSEYYLFVATPEYFNIDRKFFRNELYPVIEVLQKQNLENLMTLTEQKREDIESNLIKGPDDLDKKKDLRDSILKSLAQSVEGRARFIPKLMSGLNEVFELSDLIDGYRDRAIVELQAKVAELEQKVEQLTTGKADDSEVPPESTPGTEPEPDVDEPPVEPVPSESDPVEPAKTIEDFLDEESSARKSKVAAEPADAISETDKTGEVVKPTITIEEIVKASKVSRFKRLIKQWNFFSETVFVANKRTEGVRLNGEELAVMQYLRNDEQFALDSKPAWAINRPHQIVWETLSEILHVRNLDAMLARCLVARSKDKSISLIEKVLSPNEIEASRRLFVLATKLLGDQFPISPTYLTEVSQKINDDEINGIIDQVKARSEKDTVKKPRTLFRGDLLETREEAVQMLREILLKRKDLLYLLFEKSVPEEKANSGGGDGKPPESETDEEALKNLKSELSTKLSGEPTNPKISDAEVETGTRVGTRLLNFFLDESKTSGLRISQGNRLLSNEAAVNAIQVALQKGSNVELNKLLEQLKK